MRSIGLIALVLALGCAGPPGGEAAVTEDSAFAALQARNGRAMGRYLAEPLTRGAQVRIVTEDSVGVAAIHQFLAFQRGDHRTAGHGH